MPLIFEGQDFFKDPKYALFHLCLSAPPISCGSMISLDFLRFTLQGFHSCLCSNSFYPFVPLYTPSGFIIIWHVQTAIKTHQMGTDTYCGVSDSAALKSGSEIAIIIDLKWITKNGAWRTLTCQSPGRSMRPFNAASTEPRCYDCYCAPVVFSRKNVFFSH